MAVQTRPHSAGVASPAGPQGHWLLGNLPQFARDPLGSLEQAALLARVPRLRFITSTTWLAVDPEDIKHVLVDNQRAYHKGYGLQALKPIVGEGLLTSEDEVHQRQRRLIQPAFHRSRIESYASIMAAYAELAVARWSDGEALDLHAEMMHLTMLIVAKCFFDAELDHDAAHDASQLGVAITRLIEQFNPTRIGPIGQVIDRFDLKKRRERRRNLDILDGMILDLIRSRRAEGRDRGDLLSMILDSVDAEAGSGQGQGMSDRQARDELVTLFLAGHETTAIALTWTFYLLSRHADVEARLLAELNDVLGSPQSARLPTLRDLDRLPYARKVFAESMRLYPPAYATARIALADDDFGGVHVSKGQSVIVSQWVTHHDPRWWEDPERFEPDRFDADAEAQRPRFAYFPFGGGARRCIGEQFAWMEGQLLLATIAHRFHLELQPGYEPALHPRVTLRPRDGMPMTARRRV